MSDPTVQARDALAHEPTAATTLSSELGYASLAVALAAASAALAERGLGFVDLSLFFITAVMFVSVRTRMSVAVYAATLAFLAYNFFFIHPRYSFYIAARQGVATVALFLAAALICGRLANRLRSQVILLRATHARVAAQQGLAQRLMAAADESEAIAAAVHALNELLDAEVVILSLDESSGRLRETSGPADRQRYDPPLQVAAERCLARQRGEVRDGDGDEDVAWHCLPLVLGARVLGVVCLRFPSPLPQLPVDLARLIEAMVRDLAQAMARARLVSQLEAARMQGETERLRSALLSSVSHDLRSPLSTIIGSAESLSVYRDRLSTDDQQALAQDILDQGQRLDRYIQNLLDMTRLGQGAPAVASEWLRLDEVCGALLARVRKHRPEARIELHLPTPAPWLRAQPALIEQALFNILDNALKFSPPGLPVRLEATADGDHLQIDIVDRGPGIPESDRSRVFDMFHSVNRGDQRQPGTGLGLTISQGILAAHGGEVEALAAADGPGARIRIRLPWTDPPADRSREE